jgi:exonuclease III
MRLITWNCQGAFRKKAEAILTQKPDILVIQECEHPDKLLFDLTTQLPTDFLWFGDNKHKGLGIFSYSEYRFQLHDKYNEQIKFIVPLSVTGGQLDFTLFAIWANNVNDPEGQYIEQVWKAVNYYEELITEGQTILTGDFNSNRIWDKPYRVGTHSTVVEKLAEKGIISVYHRFFEQEQGKECHPTFFLQRNQNKPYHIDYCFATTETYEKVENLEIGTYENWIKHSDHLPVIVDFELDKQKEKLKKEITNA